MQDTTRKLEELLKSYSETDWYPFHMPGHKRQIPGCETDITEIDGFDNLHHPEKILKEEADRASELYGTKETIFSVNGSSGALLAAVSAAAKRGGHIWIERCAHISVYHAAVLRNLSIRYIGADSAEEVLRKGEKKPDAILITSPTYEGGVKHIAAWAEAAHNMGAVLLVDEAHGAHFSMHPCFPESAVKQGADLVVQSLHKTLPAMTQTALLHNVTGRVSGEKLHRFMDFYETSSPSYVLMASITQCLHFLEEDRERAFESYVRRLVKLRKALSRMQVLRLAGGAEGIFSSADALPGHAGGMRQDPGKIVILGGNAVSGPALYRAVRQRFHLQPEMKAPGYVLFMTSVCDTEEGFRRLEEALLTLDQELADEKRTSGDTGREDVPIPAEKEANLPEETALPKVCMLPADAMEADAEQVPLENAAGRVAADFLCMYPPDVPLVVPGEKIPKSLPERIKRLVNEGYEITGIDGERVWVVS